ncbi:MAG: 4Fe-4S dicluster domain-containing protein [Bacillota bacterium]
MDLLRAALDCGVVGAGGAGFPTYVKLKAKSDTIIVNGAECEPLLRVDQELMAAHAEILAEGLSAVMDFTGAKKGFFALKAKYHQAADSLRSAAKTSGNAIKVFKLGDFYPAGDEHVLVHEVTGRTAPAGGIPPDAGVTVINVETLYNLVLAGQGKPVIVKYVTVAGAVTRPATFAVPVGIAFHELIDLSGGVTVKEYGLIEGGPLMGRLSSPDQVVTKTTKGIIVLPTDHPCLTGKRVNLKAQIRRAAASCCNCRMCTDLCPRYLLGHPLEPHHSLNAIAYGLADRLERYTQAYLCSECGVCDTYACQMGLSPRALHVEIKRQLVAAQIGNPFRQKVEAREERQWRRIPGARMIARLDLVDYNTPAPLAGNKVTPRRVYLLLKQDAGVPGIPLVKPGDYVSVGQKIAAPAEGKLGGVLHASMDGKVSRVDQGIEITAV